MKKNYGKAVAMLWIALLCSAPSLLAQNMVRGTVTEGESGKPIPYVYVLVKGTSIGTMTSEEGTYIINAPPNAVLIFSSIGYVSLEEAISNRLTVNVSLDIEAFGLEEVIAVAYTTTRRKDLTSSVASMRGDELSNAPTSSFNEAMQGKMAGVMITSASGSPGGAITIRIRGASSITAGNDPLYVVDGVPMTATDYSQIGMGGQTTNPLSSINPSDIENIQVLKDASAAALYGSRASNGVVIISTKRGAAQRARVTIDSYYGVQDLQREVKFLRTEEWLIAQNEARRNYNTSLGLSQGSSGYANPVVAEVPGADTYWFKEVTNKNPMTATIQASVSGGNENTQFRLSAAWYRQVGLQKPSEFERYNFSARVGHRFNAKVRIDFNARFTTSDNYRMYGDNNIYGPLFNGARNRPDQPVYDPNDPTGYYKTTTNNPVACFMEMYSLNRNQRLMGDVRIEWKVYKELTFRTSMAANFLFLHEHNKFSSKAPQAALYLDQGRHASGYGNNYLIENMLSYNKAFGKLNLSVLAGQSFVQDQITRTSFTATGFPIDSFRWLESAAKPESANSRFRENLIESYFGRLSANIDDKYMVEGSIRSDASSKFAKEHRLGIFPAGSVAWRLSKESFFPQNSVLTDVKVRGSVGLTGNIEGIAEHRYLTLYEGGSDYDLNPGMFPQAAMATPNLTWEKTLQTDLGLDLIFLNGRMEFTYDYFIKETKDLLLSRNVPITTGHSSRTENVGKRRIKGHEFSLFSRNVMGRKFRWNTSFNISFEDNVITAVGKNPQGEWEAIATGNFSRIEVGYPISFYVIKATGIYQSDSEVPESLYRQGIRAGDVKFEDFNKDGEISAADRQMSKNGFPDIYGGLSNMFSYKGLDAEIGLVFSIGNYVYTYWKQQDGAANGGRSLFGIMAEQWERRWTPENPHNNPMYPRFVYGSSGAGGYNAQTATSRWLQDASFLRIKSLSIGYILSSNIVQKLKIEKVRLYVSAQNLYTWTKYDGMDPEVNANPGSSTEIGTDFFTFPQMRTITFGAQITF